MGQALNNVKRLQQVAFVTLVGAVADTGGSPSTQSTNQAAFTAALATGKDVFIPSVPDGVSAYWVDVGELAPVRAGQRIFGEGVRSLVRCSKPNTNVFHVTSLDDVKFDDMHVIPDGTRTAQNNGNAIFFEGCQRGKAQGVVVQGHRGAGVAGINSNDCKVLECWFLNSPARTATIDSDAYADVAFTYSSSRNIVNSNHMLSGQGVAAMFQSILNGDVCDGNQACHNVIDGPVTYGLLAYRNAQILADVPLQSVRGTIFANNRITNVQGQVASTVVPGTYPYGASIYIQGAEGTVVAENTGKGSHKAAVTFTELLAPGAIGVTNVSRVTVVGNYFDDCGMYGLVASDPNGFGDALGYLSANDNSFTRCTKAAFNIHDRDRVKLDGNTGDTTGLSAFRFNPAASAFNTDYTVTNNKARNVTGVGGFDFHWIDGLVESGNSVDTSSTHGLVFANCKNVTSGPCNVKNHTSRGVQFASTCSQVTLAGRSTIVGTGASAEGIRLDCLVEGVDPNQHISGCVTRWAGNYAVLRGVSTGLSAPNTNAAKTDLNTFTLPAGWFTTNGDSVSVYAAGTATNNANAKQVTLEFGGTVVYTATITAGQTSDWRFDARITRTGASAQRVAASFQQGRGATKQADFVITATTEAEASAITVKTTGTGVASNDIFGLFLDVDVRRG